MSFAEMNRKRKARTESTRNVDSDDENKNAQERRKFIHSDSDDEKNTSNENEKTLDVSKRRKVIEKPKQCASESPDSTSSDSEDANHFILPRFTVDIMRKFMGSNILVYDERFYMSFSEFDRGFQIWWKEIYGKRRRPSYKIELCVKERNLEICSDSRPDYDTSNNYGALVLPHTNGKWILGVTLAETKLSCIHAVQQMTHDRLHLTTNDFVPRNIDENVNVLKLLSGLYDCIFKTCRSLLPDLIRIILAYGEIQSCVDLSADFIQRSDDRCPNGENWFALKQTDFSDCVVTPIVIVSKLSTLSNNKYLLLVADPFIYFEMTKTVNLGCDMSHRHTTQHNSTCSCCYFCAGKPNDQICINGSSTYVPNGNNDKCPHSDDKKICMDESYTKVSSQELPVKSAQATGFEHEDTDSDCGAAVSSKPVSHFKLKPINYKTRLLIVDPVDMVYRSDLRPAVIVHETCQPLYVTFNVDWFPIVDNSVSELAVSLL